MWEEEVLPRALQNHLLQARHLTTLLGLWIPQYLREYTVSKECVAISLPTRILTRMHVGEALSPPPISLGLLHLQRSGHSRCFRHRHLRQYLILHRHRHAVEGLGLPCKYYSHPGLPPPYHHLSLAWSIRGRPVGFPGEGGPCRRGIQRIKSIWKVRDVRSGFFSYRDT